ncbi:MAG: DNA repair protein RadC [Ignavibacteria bacterium]|nr:DNA repair protein RadC [Ignavibacteria bacterium]MBI3764991.1 DNA repair protein RadC [Ignavibacteriales bacterium]
MKKVSEPSVYHSKIPDWPREERPREKLMRHGSSALSEAELLAIVIRTGAGSITAVDLAKTLLKEFRSLDDLASRSFQELRRYKGLGDVKSITLVAAFELGRRAAVATRAVKFQITSPADVVNRFQSLHRDLRHEVFKVLLLDSANHLLRDVTITKGILNSALVHPREVFREAIMEPAASIILLHNHPSGNPEPSPEDLQITRQIVEAGKIIGIPVHDHIIIAADKFTSFVERGLI